MVEREMGPAAEETKPRRPVRRPRRPLTKADYAFYLLLLLAAIFRLYRPDLVSFTADEGIHGIGAMEIAVFESFPMVGLPSVGIRNSALFLYTLAFPFLFWFNPIAGVLFVAGLNLLAFWLCWRIGRRVFGPWPSLAGLSLIAFSPWAVIYARNMWPPSCVVVPCLLLIDRTLAWLDGGGNRRLAFLVAWSFVCPQMHFSGFCAPVWLAMALWTGRRRLSGAAVLAGIAAGLATWTPWIYWQHFINRWEDIGQVLRNARGTATLAETAPAACRWWLQLMGTGGFDYWFGFKPETFPELFPEWSIQAGRWLDLVLGIGAVAAVAWLGIFGQPAQRLLAFWSVLPLAMLALLRPAMHPHYVWIAYPIPMLALGGAIGSALGKSTSRMTTSVGVALAALMLAGVAAVDAAHMRGWFRYLADDRPTGAGHFQLSLRQRILTTQSILDDWKKTNANGVAGLFSGEQPAYGFVFHYFLVSRRLSRRPVDPTLVYWVDEESGDSIGPAAIATLRNWRKFENPRVVRHWRVGPSRIFLVESAPP